MFSVAWLKDAAERAAATFAQALIAILLVGTPIFELDWSQGLGIAATAALVSLLKSVVATKFNDPESAALIPKA